MRGLILMALAASTLAACGDKPSPVPVARRPDAGLLQPCDRPVGLPRPNQVEVSAAWLEAERLLAKCAAEKDALIEFERGQ